MDNRKKIERGHSEKGLDGTPTPKLQGHQRSRSDASFFKPINKPIKKLSPPATNLQPSIAQDQQTVQRINKRNKRRSRRFSRKFSIHSVENSPMTSPAASPVLKRK